MRYDFEVQYVNTKNFGYVDMLSRLVNKNEHEDMIIVCTQLEKDLSSILNDQISRIPVTFNMVQQATSKCKQLQQVIRLLSSRWESEIEHDMLPYF